MCSHRRRRHDKTVSSRRRCVFGFIIRPIGIYTDRFRTGLLVVYKVQPVAAADAAELVAVVTVMLPQEPVHVQTYYVLEEDDRYTTELRQGLKLDENWTSQCFLYPYLL